MAQISNGIESPHVPEEIKSILKSSSKTTKKSKRIPPASIGRMSSIGDVGTIRSKLHERRAQLNKEITVENRIRQGSRKLARMTSLNDKARDQAKLEHEFSKSKIQVLQTELARINSSVQAYQPKSARSTQVPLIPLALKTTSEVKFSSFISEMVADHYHTDPALLHDSIDRLQNLRQSITMPSKDQVGIDLLYEYFSHLILMIKRFLNSNVAPGFVFIWHDAINGLPAAQKSTAYEKACVIFNLAALHTQIAAQQDRSTRDGINKSISHLENSLGVFEYMKHNFSYSPTLDMTNEILSLLSDLMRAQVTELQWERTVLEGLNEKDTVKLVEYAQTNKLIAECYKPIRDLVEDASLKDYLPTCWSALIKIKDAHFRSQAHYYASIIHERLGIQSRSVSQEDLLALRRASLDAELHFMYTTETTNTEELFSAETKVQIGLAKSHLNCASLLHEYALRYMSMSKELEPIEVLKKLLEKASASTQEQKEAIAEYESTAMIAPTIQPAEIEIYPVLPNFTRVKVVDLFKSLGPLPHFSADNTWAKPRKVTLVMIEKTYGFSVKGSKPARISEVEEDSSAKEQEVAVGDWVLAINNEDVRYASHSDIVKLVQRTAPGLLVLELTTPISINNRKMSNPSLSLPSPSLFSQPSNEVFS